MSERSERILDAADVERVLKRMASEIVEATGGADRLGIVGIRRGGLALSARLAEAVGAVASAAPPVGSVDIALYRDDAATALPDPKIGPSVVPFEVAGRDVVLVDDVLQTGRTVRAAIECLLDYGRPRRIWLAVLLDRGGRELPVAADFVGRTVSVPAGGKVRVVLGESAGSEDAALLERAEDAP
ncbi:MAG: bifunctional pyr operon transcriptional regulator/uracil phosphoribosyltransferase PyrR [Myxococcota bacterium]